MVNWHKLPKDWSPRLLQIHWALRWFGIRSSRPRESGATCTLCDWTPPSCLDSFRGNPQRGQAGIRLLSGYKDDVTGILWMAPSTTRLLRSLDEHLEWARMIIKAAKSRSLLIRKGIQEIINILIIQGEPIPRLDKKPLQSEVQSTPQTYPTGRWGS